jgi:hypothetical protein
VRQQQVTVPHDDRIGADPDIHDGQHYGRSGHTTRATHALLGGGSDVPDGEQVVEAVGAIAAIVDRFRR